MKLSETERKLVEAVRHIPLDSYDEDPGMVTIQPWMGSVLLDQEGGEIHAVGVSSHRIANAWTEDPSEATKTRILNAATLKKSKAKDMPPWQDAWEKARPKDPRTVTVSRVVLLGCMLRLVTMTERSFSLLEAERIERGDKAPEPCCPCDHPDRSLLRDISARELALRFYEDHLAVESLGCPGKIAGIEYENEHILDGEPATLGMCWWYFTQALTFALSDAVELAFGGPAECLEVRSEADGVTLVSVIMPMLLDE